MNNTLYMKLKTLIIENGIFYIIGILLALALKYYYSKASYDDLDWILAPTAWWVQLLSGIPFEKVQDAGYVNHQYQFVIAPACSGINFMIIAFATLIFAFTHHKRTAKSKLMWLAACIILIYPYTILTNSIRIIPSIFLLHLDIYSGWLTPERVHSIEGTLVYFGSLLFLYFTVEKALAGGFKKDSKREHHKNKSIVPYKCLLPVFIYFSITLGLPLLNGAISNDPAKFLEHAILVTLVCFLVILLLSLFLVLRRSSFKIHNKQNSK